jgi:hypothetical protein
MSPFWYPNRRHPYKGQTRLAAAPAATALDLKSCTAERVLVNVRAQARTVARLGRGALTSPSPVTASLPPVAPRMGPR